jgi:hypothetical protein
MTPAMFRKHLDRLGLTQAAFSRLIKVDIRTVKRWASLTDPFEIPRTVQILLPLLSPTRVKALLAATESCPPTPLKSPSARCGAVSQ